MNAHSQTSTQPAPPRHTFPRRDVAGVSATVLLLFLAPAGCGDAGPTRYEVSGTVQYQGQPVPFGRITFTPDATQGNPGPQGVATIQDGRYSTAAGGRGTVGGPHQVRIVGYDGVPVQGEEFMMNEGKPLFPEYTTQVGLPRQATEIDFEVPHER